VEILLVFLLNVVNFPGKNDFLGEAPGIDIYISAGITVDAER
jgi:hypothetical protein